MLPKNYSVKKETPQYEPVPAGMYQVEITDADLLEEVQTKWGPKDYLKFSLVILEGDLKGKKISYKCSTSFNAGGNGYKASNLFKLVQAALQKNIADTETFEVESLFGAQVLAMISEIETDRGTFNNIEAVSKVKELLPSVSANAPLDTPLENVSPEEVEKGLKETAEEAFDGQVK